MITILDDICQFSAKFMIFLKTDVMIVFSGTNGCNLKKIAKFFPHFLAKEFKKSG
jgi:hypothetical protein